MQMKKAVPYIIGIAVLFGIGYQQKQIYDLQKSNASLYEKISHMRMMDKETRRAVGILARDSRYSKNGPYSVDENHDLSNW